MHSVAHTFFARTTRQRQQPSLRRRLHLAHDVRDNIRIDWERCKPWHTNKGRKKFEEVWKPSTDDLTTTSICAIETIDDFDPITFAGPRHGEMVNPHIKANKGVHF